MSGAQVARSFSPPRRGRPRGEVLSVGDVGRLLELDERLVRARCRLSFFPGASEDVHAVGGWRIPLRSVELALRVRLQPFFSITSAAGLLDVGYSTLKRETVAVGSLEAPLPPGKSVRALLLFLGAGKPMMRIPECELQRVLGVSGGARRAAGGVA